MAIKKLSELPKSTRTKRKINVTASQTEKARKAKPIQTKSKVIGSRYGRLEINLGTHDKDDVPGVIKGFRRKHKADFGAIIKDESGNVLARTHIASGKTTIPESLAVRALSKYGKGYDRIKVVLFAPVPKKKVAKKAVKKATKKPVKKVAKKAVKKAVKKSTKKGKRK